MYIGVTLFGIGDMPCVFQEKRSNDQSMSANVIHPVITLQAKLVPAIRSFPCPPLPVAFIYLFLSQIRHFVSNRDIYEWKS